MSVSFMVPQVSPSKHTFSPKVGLYTWSPRVRAGRPARTVDFLLAQWVHWYLFMVLAWPLSSSMFLLLGLVYTVSVLGPFFVLEGGPIGYDAYFGTYNIKISKIRCPSWEASQGAVPYLAALQANPAATAEGLGSPARTFLGTREILGNPLFKGGFSKGYDHIRAILGYSDFPTWRLMGLSSDL